MMAIVVIQSLFSPVRELGRQLAFGYSGISRTTGPILSICSFFACGVGLSTIPCAIVMALRLCHCHGGPARGVLFLARRVAVSGFR